MNRNAVILGLIGAVAFGAFAYARNGGNLTQLGLTAPSLPTIDDQPVISGGGIPTPSVKPVASYGDKLTTDEAISLAVRIDNAEFGGWFQRLGLIDSIIGIWRVESGLKPAAVNHSDPQGGAWGIGQVLLGVAQADYGVFSPVQLQDALFGATISMRHIKSTIDRLFAATGSFPDNGDWIQAYNVGVSGFLQGRRARVYLAAVTVRKVV